MFNWLSILPALVLLPAFCLAQHAVEISVRDADSLEPLPGAAGIVKGTAIGANADGNGVIRFVNLPDGNHKIEISFVGYERQIISLDLPSEADSRTEVLLHPAGEALEEIVISSTRGTRTFADIPTRVEFIAGEELAEKGNMKPGDIRMLLNESTGIQTQQTSATSANASIRIQGLDGRYTQILKDGFPLYAGFSGGLGLLQIPPLDLKQVEVIKGSSSTLYGGGAIAGMVNLISRTPDEEGDLRFLINGTSAGGLDISGFYGKDFGKVGVTVFGSRNSNAPYDPADIGLTAIPKFTRHTFNPKVFLEIGQNAALDFGINYTEEDRIGGDIEYIKGNGQPENRYFEENVSERVSTQLSLSYRFDESTAMNVKNSLNHFSRSLGIPQYSFHGVQNSSFTEVNLVHSRKSSEWIAGVNLWTDGFSETPMPGQVLRDYHQETTGAFIQNNLRFSETISLETGLRGDYVIDYGFALLPRLSLLYRPGMHLTSRIGGGFGYKAPTIFTEESERIHLRDVVPVTPNDNELERSYGVNWDLNYRAETGPLGWSINHLFFYTRLDNPLTLNTLPNGSNQFMNISGFVDTKGTETNVRLEFGDFKLFVGYTFTDTKIHHEDAVVQHPLTAKHRLNNVLMYELEERWKVGLEGYYFSRQRLNDGTYGKDYWICGLMLERLWERFSLFLNFENFLDTRQTRFGSIYSGTITDPVFHDIYAPVDGFVINGGVKLNFPE